MKLHVHLRGVSRARELKRFIEGRFARALGGLGPSVRLAHLRIGDENGPRGGEDKSGKLVIETTDGRTLVLSETRVSGFAVAGALIDGARRTLARHCGRRDARRRGRG